MKLSILTATYNRANMLQKLYESIKKNLNSGLDCEWIIIDDGSIDNTAGLIRTFQNEKIVDIKYKFQENSGKMVAINEASKLASGELMVDCDSDDYFADDAFQIIKENVGKLLDDDSLYGMIFFKADEKGNISGDKFKTENEPTTMFNLYFKEDIKGEKIIVFKSEIRKNFEHQIENGEKFITEARMYHKMDERYKVICINKILEYGKYEEDGYTKNIAKMFKKYPYGYYEYFKEILEKDMRGVLFKKRLYVIKHYILFGVLSHHKFNIKSINDDTYFIFTDFGCETIRLITCTSLNPGPYRLVIIGEKLE